MAPVEPVEELELLEPLDVVLVDAPVVFSAVVIELCIPAETLVLAVTTVPSALSLLAVTASITCTLSTVAPLIKISSLSDFISNKLPNTCDD